jgi:hypothetical protein
MVLDSKIMTLRQKFAIRTVNDWTAVTPAEILATPDIGDATLNHLRLHLAGHGVTLKDDETPAFWQSHLFETKLGTVQVSHEDRVVVSPFTVVIDAQEKYPFQFKGLKTDGDGRPIIVRTRVESLGPTHGDYSILGMEGECHIERKSREDARGTILGFGDRRDRFENTLSFLSTLMVSAVVVECSIGELIQSCESRGKKSVEENRKILFRSILAWQVDYTVPWFFCDTRRLAEVATFRLMERAFEKQIRLQKKAEAVG